MSGKLKAVIGALRALVDARHTGVVLLRVSFNQGGIRGAAIVHQKEQKIQI